MLFRTEDIQDLLKNKKVVVVGDSGRQKFFLLLVAESKDKGTNKIGTVCLRLPIKK